MSLISSDSPSLPGSQNDAEYDGFLARVNARFLANVGDGKIPLFTTDADRGPVRLWEMYLAQIPVEVRPVHDCRACEQFVTRFGGLATIDAEGRTHPAIWNADDAPSFYRPAVQSVAAMVGKANPTGVFLSSDGVWGRPETGVWHHFAVRPPASMVFQRATQTANQAMAEKREDYKAVRTALDEFTPATLEQALKLLETESLYRSEKVLGQAQWLANLHAARARARGASAKANVVWLAVATAPAGFCHPRSSMIGTLLENIAAGMNFAEVSRRFADKMHPLQYQRPQAPPRAGAIAAAEKLVAQLGAAGSLARRYCRVDEVEALWKPTPQSAPPSSSGGVFGHLTPKEATASNAPNLKAPPVVMTWEKFARTVLPDAEQIEFFARDAKDNYTVLLTAVNADAPPILQWNTEAARNPVSSYVWMGGSLPRQFGLAGNAYHNVVAVTLAPSMWGPNPNAYPHQGKSVLFLLDGAQESRNAGIALFPEILKAEFHGIRAVIETYSGKGEIEGGGAPSAIGIGLNGGGSWNARFHVTARGRVTEYSLDRWD